MALNPSDYTPELTTARLTYRYEVNEIVKRRNDSIFIKTVQVDVNLLDFERELMTFHVGILAFKVKKDGTPSKVSAGYVSFPSDEMAQWVRRSRLRAMFDLLSLRANLNLAIVRGK